jgi:hypothetical protein
MKLIDLISGPDGKLSHTRLWNNVGGAVMTSIVLHQHFALGKLSDDLLIWYGGLLIAGVVANKAVNALPGAK